MDRTNSILDNDDSSSDESSIEENVGGSHMNLPVKKKPEKEKARWTDDEVNIVLPLFQNSLTHGLSFFHFYIRMRLFVNWCSK